MQDDAGSHPRRRSFKYNKLKMDDPPTTTPNENKSTDYHKKIKDIINAIQIEPACFLNGFASGIEDVFLNKLILDKVCDVQLGYEENICENLDSGQYEEEQNQVQRLTSIYGMGRSYVQSLPVIVAVFLLAALAQSRGLKLPLMLPVAGELLKVLFIIMNVLNWSLPPVFIILSCLPYAICGGYAGFYNNIYSYVCLTSEKKSRTTRLALVGVLECAGMSLGVFTSPYIYNQLGYVGVFTADALFIFLQLLFLLLRAKNYKPEPEPDSSDNTESKNMIKRMKMILSTTFKKRENKGRTQIVGHLTILSLYIFMMGAPTYNYLYTRKKFSWDYETYSNWSAISMPFYLVGTVIILPSLSYIWGVDDNIIGLIGYISRMWQFMLIATAPVGWVMYLATLTSVGGGIIQIASRSALSKIVPSSELTSIFAMIPALENIIPILTNPMYTYIYNATLVVFPGTVFAIASAISCIGCFLYTWLYTSFPSDVKIQEQPVVDDTEMAGGSTQAFQGI